MAEFGKWNSQLRLKPPCLTSWAWTTSTSSLSILLSLLPLTNALPYPLRWLFIRDSSSGCFQKLPLSTSAYFSPAGSPMCELTHCKRRDGTRPINNHQHCDSKTRFEPDTVRPAVMVNSCGGIPSQSRPIPLPRIEAFSLRLAFSNTKASH